jgi:Uncharacterized conserved protein (DUF2276).
MAVRDLVLSRFEARIRFTSDAKMPRWAGNALRSGFGARLRDLVCVDGGASFDDNCAGCPHRENCVYDRFYNARPPENAQVLRKQAAISRPFVLDPLVSGEYRIGEGAVLGFTLFGGGVEYLPYFILALRNLGESGLGRGYRDGYGRYDLEFIDSLGFGQRENVFSGGTVFNRVVSISYGEILRRSEEHRGAISLRFTTPTQIKENDRFTTEPSFRGLVSRLLFRANILAEFHGTGMLYDNEKTLRILGRCREVKISSARTRKMHQKRYFRDQGRDAWLPPFFTGEINYSGEFSEDVMALLELGQVIHVGKMATFGNGRYEVGV